MFSTFDHQNIEARKSEIEDFDLMDRIRSRDERALETLIKPHETGIPPDSVETRIELGVKKLRAAVSVLASREEWLPGTA